MSITKKLLPSPSVLTCGARTTGVLLKLPSRKSNLLKVTRSILKLGDGTENERRYGVRKVAGVKSSVSNFTNNGSHTNGLRIVPGNAERQRLVLFAIKPSPLS